MHLQLEIGVHRLQVQSLREEREEGHWAYLDPYPPLAPPAAAPPPAAPLAPPAAPLAAPPPAPLAAAPPAAPPAAAPPPAAPPAAAPPPPAPPPLAPPAPVYSHQWSPWIWHTQSLQHNKIPSFQGLNKELNNNMDRRT